MSLPDYADTPEEPPFGPALVELPFVVTDSCDNDGTAEFELIRWGDFVQTRGWVYDFEECQDDADVHDGVLSKADSSIRFVSSPGFTLDTPNGRTRFRGNVDRNYQGSRGSSSARYWRADSDAPYFTPNAYDPSASRVDFVLTDPDGNVTFELLDASTNFGHDIPLRKYLAGDFSVRSEVTGGECLDVRVLEYAPS